MQTTAGLGAALGTLGFTINLAAHHSPRVSKSFQLLTGMLRQGKGGSARSGFSLSAMGGLVSDLRRTLRLIGLIPLYLRLKSVLSSSASYDNDPVLRRILVAQCSAFLVYQAIENIYHLHVKGITPASIVNRNGGLATWIAWSCRAWAFAVLCDLVRLWRQAQNSKMEKAGKMADEEQILRRKWWRELITSALWLPVATHSSFYPEGIACMNPGRVALAGLLASLNSLINQWEAAA